ncbi:MAG: myo-inositol-1-phosphate synthase [Gemmatimonadetes bacterium]|nr:MAG: myo-inositol-1-phosphate synthase [Gemmatimonadota bacterium]
MVDGSGGARRPLRTSRRRRPVAAHRGPRGRCADPRHPRARRRHRRRQRPGTRFRAPLAPGVDTLGPHAHSDHVAFRRWGQCRHSPPPTPHPGFVKLWIVGARGSIATTLAAGVLAAQRGLAPLEALLTETEAFVGLGLAALPAIDIGGCDLAPGTLAQSAHAALAGVGTFPVAMIDALMPDLERIAITRGVLRGGGAAIDALAGDQRAATASGTAREVVDRLVTDIRAFAQDEPTVVVNLASTEPTPAAALADWDGAALRRAVDDDDPRIPSSCLYALAAIEAGCPHANFTPSAGASLPAIVELARAAGVPLAGRDGKTGETLLKTALAPMFPIRALTVEGWYGTNILGNTDGLVLADPDNKASKITSKKGVLEGILGYAPEGDVRIDYFKPLADHKVAWNFIQFRGWGGHRMRMQFTWEGTDSVLAAPLVLDIARLALLAQRRGESGPIGALGLFFKTPEGSSEMNLYKQYDALLRWTSGRSAAG